MTTTPALAVASDFILSHATEEDLTRITETVKQQRTTLAAIRTAALTTGMPVQTAGLSPRYLNGLTGTISRIGGKRARVTLDAESTDRLRLSPTNRRFHVPFDATNYDLTGVPLSCCLPT